MSYDEDLTLSYAERANQENYEKYLALSRARLAAYKTYKFWETASNQSDFGVMQERFKAANEYNRLNELCREWEVGKP